MENSVIYTFLFLLSTITNSLSLVIFLKCRLMFLQIRIILLASSLHTVLCSCLALCLDVYVAINKDIGGGIICKIDQFVKAVCVLVPLALTTHLTVDRYVSVTWPFWHTRVITKRCTITICLVITVVIYLLGCFFHKDILNPMEHSSREISCLGSLDTGKFGTWVQITILTLCIIFATVSWTGIFYHSRKYTRTIFPTTGSREGFTSIVGTFRMSILIFGTTLVQFILIIPIYVVNISRISNMNNVKLATIDSNISFAFIGTLILNPIIYISRFRECHFHALKLYCFCSKQMQEKAERLESAFRLDHAGIPTPAVSRSLVNSPVVPQKPLKTPEDVFTIHVPINDQLKWGKINKQCVIHPLTERM